MHRVVGGIALLAIAAGCTLGVVDLPPGPSPAELLIISEMAVDPDDPSTVQVKVNGTLDPGIGPQGEPRSFTSDLLRVEGVNHAPLESGFPPRWHATVSYPEPGPQAVQLVLPALLGFGPASTVNMRVRVDVTSGGTIVLGDGEDLVLTAEPPSNPAQTLEWSLELTSPSTPAFRVSLTGDESWPAELRVPADQLPASALPVEATLRIRWDRSLTLFELTAEERYELALRSIMTVAWTVEGSG